MDSIAARARRSARRALLAPLLALLAGGVIWLAAPGGAQTTRGAQAEGDAHVARALADANICTVIFVRHAEKDASGDPKDPGLGDAGRTRAAALARLLSAAGVSRLYASEFRRAQETLAPLAERTRRTIEVVPAGDSARLIEALASAPSGSVSVVAGHSNTIPALIEQLGGRVADLDPSARGSQLRETEFDRLFVVTLGPPAKSGESSARSAISTLELRYGD